MLQESKAIKINKHSIGCLLAYAYIFTSYIAQDILISSQLNSVFLYAFLLSSVYIFVTSMKIDTKDIGFTLWYIVFMIVSAALMLKSPSISGVFGSYYAMIVSLLVSLCLKIHIKTERGFRRICWCYSISSFAFVVLLFFTGNLSGTAEERLGQEILGNANIFASLMMVGVMFSIWILLYDCSGMIQKIAVTGMIIFKMYSLALSGGRKFFIIPFIFFYLLLLNKQDKRGKRHTILHTVLFVFVLIIVWNLIMKVPVFYNSIGIRMEGLIENFQGENGDSSAEIRKILRDLAFEKWLERPLSGYGFDSFKYLAQSAVGHFYYSHCNYTELLYSGGIFYFLLYYWGCWMIIKNCLKNKELPDCYRAFSVAGVVSFFIFDYGAVSYNATYQIAFLMMAYSVSNFKKTINHTKEI